MKRYQKRLAAFGLAAVMAVSCLTGCGTKKKNNNSSTSEYDPTGETELTGEFELQIFTGGYGSQAWEEIISAFEELHPDLEVTAYMDNNVNSQMQTRWMQSDPPDFVFLTGSDLPTGTYIDEGKFEDLTSFYEKATVYGEDTLLKDKLTSVRYYDKSIYYLPLITDSYGMWYDDAYLKEKGLTVPTNYDEMLAFGQAAKAKGVNSLIYPGQHAMYLVHGLIFPALAVYGQDYLDRVAGAKDVDAFKDQRMRDVLTRVKGLIDAGMFVDGTVALNHTQSQMQWLQHQAAFIPNGLWLENEMKDDIPDGFVMNYAPSMLVKPDEKQVICTMDVSVGVASEGDNKEAALEFLRFLYKDENVVKFAEYANAFPATNIDLSGYDLSETSKRAQAVLSDPKYDHVAVNLGWGEVDEAMKDGINQLVLGKLDVDGLIDVLVKAAQAKLDHAK